MLVTVTEYSGNAYSNNGVPLPIGAKKSFVGVKSRTSDGSVSLGQNTRLIRVATDTPITINPNGAPELVQGGEWFDVGGGETLAIATL